MQNSMSQNRKTSHVIAVLWKATRYLLLTLHWALWATLSFAYYFVFTQNKYRSSIFDIMEWGMLAGILTGGIFILGIGWLLIRKEFRLKWLRFTSIVLLPGLMFVLVKNSIDFRSNELTGKEQRIELSYIAWACDCANWANDVNRIIEEEENDRNGCCIFIEPANSAVALPDSMQASGNKIIFTGQFYKNPGYPKGYYSDENPEPAPVFRYTSYQIKHPFYVWHKPKDDAAAELVQIK